MDLSEWHDWWKRAGVEGVNTILRRDWNPIGTRVPANEYASYAGQVGRMLRERASTTDIAAHLAEARIESMGGAADPEADAEVAMLLVAWYERETGDLG